MIPKNLKLKSTCSGCGVKFPKYIQKGYYIKPYDNRKWWKGKLVCKGCYNRLKYHDGMMEIGTKNLMVGFKMENKGIGEVR